MMIMTPSCQIDLGFTAGFVDPLKSDESHFPSAGSDLWGLWSTARSSCGAYFSVAWDTVPWPRMDILGHRRTIETVWPLAVWFCKPKPLATWFRSVISGGATVVLPGFQPLWIIGALTYSLGFFLAPPFSRSLPNEGGWEQVGSQNLENGFLVRAKVTDWDLKNLE
jgi:hypothetical protein